MGLRDLIGELAHAWSEAMRKAENIRYFASIEAGQKSGLYSISDNHCQMFRNIRSIVLDKGEILSDNTPGDAFVTPLSANKNYEIIRKFENLTLTLTNKQSKTPFREYEEMLNRSHYQNRDSAAVSVLETKGLRIVAHTDMWAHPVFLRFDKGSADELHAIHQRLSRSRPSFSIHEVI